MLEFRSTVKLVGGTDAVDLSQKRTSTQIEGANSG